MFTMFIKDLIEMKIITDNKVNGNSIKKSLKKIYSDISNEADHFEGLSVYESIQNRNILHITYVS